MDDASVRVLDVDPTVHGSIVAALIAKDWNGLWMDGTGAVLLAENKDGQRQRLWRERRFHGMDTSEGLTPIIAVVAWEARDRDGGVIWADPVIDLQTGQVIGWR